MSWAHGEPIHRAEQRVGLAVSPDLMQWSRYDLQGQDGLILDGPDHEEHPWSAFDTDGIELPWEYDCRDPFVFDRGADAGPGRWVMLNSVRLAPDAQLMAIAYATSDDLVHWTWQHYFPVTVGEKAESANLLAHGGHHYLFWTDRNHAPAVRVAVSTTGIFGQYELLNGDARLFGLGNETLAEPERTVYFAFDDFYLLHVKPELLLPDMAVPGAPVRLTEFTRCLSGGPIGYESP